MRISIVYMGDINALNGASKVVNSFIKYQDIFNQNDIIISNIYTSRDEVLSREMSQLNKNNRNRIVKDFLSHGIVGNLVSIYLQYFRNGKIAANKILTNKDDSDLLIFHDIFSCYMYYKQIKNKGKKSILVLHTNGETWKMIYEYFPKLNKNIFRKRFNKIEKFVCDNVNKIVFVSKLSENNFLKIYPRYEHKTSHIYNGINEGNSIQKELEVNSLNLISVGTLNSRKAQNLIIESLAQVGDKSIKLTLVGDGEKRGEFEEIAKKENILSQITFLGSRNDVELILPKHNLFIMSSKDEGLPISIIEAMKHGLPIIATDVGGISELIDGNGILVDPNVESISGAIKKINDNKSILKEMSIKSKANFREKFLVNKMICNYSDLVREIIYHEY